MIKLSLFILIAALAIFLAVFSGLHNAPEPFEKKESLQEQVVRKIKASTPTEVEQFHKFEIDIALPDELTVEDFFRFDAYDADNDGKFIRADCVFTHMDTGEQFDVPAFFMKESASGEWQLKCRFSPNFAGEWRYVSTIRYGTDGDEKAVAGEEKTFRCAQTKETGPMVKHAESRNPNYLYRLKPDGSREVFWGMPVCRPWVVRNHPEKHFRDEWTDRETELFAPMREHGCNLLSMWMAPWELLICHKSPNEHWQIIQNEKPVDGAFGKHTVENPEQWRSYAYYDQGRARAMDRILEAAEVHDERCGGPIYVFLAFMPHQLFLIKKGQWDGAYTEEELEQYHDEEPEKLFGLADFGKRIEWLDWFKASPEIEDKDDWRRQYWDWQANFARYVIARWGYSRSLGMWVIMDELDGMGESGALRSLKNGWWSTPDCDRWHDDFLRMFRGELEGYDGDPFGHLITSSTMFYDYLTGEDVNGTWDGGEEKVDAVTYHSYPVYRVFGEWVAVDGRHEYVQRIDEDDEKVYGVSAYHSNYIPADTSTWAYAAERINDWSRAVGGGRPRIVTESGFIERPTGQHPSDFYGKKYPTVYHYQLWAALVSGHAAAPFDWNDGKEFGEMRWRERDGEFGKEDYPINLYTELDNIQRFLKGEDISEYQVFHDEKIESPDNLTVWCIADEAERVLGWVFVNSESIPADDELSFEVSSLDAESDYEVQWYNTWTGEKIGGPVKLKNLSGKVVLKAGNFLRKSTVQPEEGPNDFVNNPNDLCDDGKDAAFKIIRR